MGLKLALPLMLALAGCATTANNQPVSTGETLQLACDDSIKANFKPDASTKVLEVRTVRKGEEIAVPDWPTKVKIAADLCLVKLLVGPGVTQEKDSAARSYSEGIGIEIWLPEKTAWNQRIRNYGGGGWVGGDHRYPGKVGSKYPAPVIAGMGYVSATTDAGQPWYQDGSFIFLSDGKVNQEGLRNFSYQSLYEQAIKSKQLVKAYYGKEASYSYFDGHSQGGRQSLKLMQERPELYDGYLVAQSAVSLTKLDTTRVYAQIVLKAELGFNAANPAAQAGGKTPAQVYADKVNVANARAVASCDKAGLGFLLDPFSCNYDPAKDAGLLCVGVNGSGGVTGNSSIQDQCMTLAEAQALNRIWYGPALGGSFDPQQSYAERSGVTPSRKQLWWTHAKGTNITGLITKAGTDVASAVLQDVRYAASASYSANIAYSNSSTNVRDKWQELTYADAADIHVRALTLQPLLGNIATDNPDLTKMRDLGRKAIAYNGLADDAIPPASMVHYYNQVAVQMGGIGEVQKFMRLYMFPGAAHSSQGRAYTVDPKRINAVPLPKLPGAINQTPTRETDQMFTALQDWVEKGQTPGELMMESRDKTISYPVCVYPKMTAWDGVGPVERATSFACR